MRWALLIVGALLILAGVVWTLQGLDYLGGSAMSGEPIWAVIGPITAAVGLVLAFIGARRLRSR